MLFWLKILQLLLLLHCRVKKPIAVVVNAVKAKINKMCGFMKLFNCFGFVAPRLRLTYHFLIDFINLSVYFTLRAIPLYAERLE